MTRGQFTPPQVKQLLRGINQKRVLSDGKGHSHVSQQDVTAHLIRTFGFGSFDTELIGCELIFESERTDSKTGALTGRWDVCYRATMRLTVRNPDGEEVAHYEDGSTATAQNQTRGDGHDLAMKSAISLAKKRAAINLGDQFGLSLYNKGQIEPLVIGTMIGTESHDEDLQAKVPQQVSLGNDEIDRTDDRPVPPEGWRARIAAAMDQASVSEIHAEAVEAGWATAEVMSVLVKRRDTV
jgi:hypothetical protein